MSEILRDPMTALSELALRQHGLVTRPQALASGCSDHVLQRLCRDGSLRRVERGVYRLSGAPRTFEQRVLAACLARPDSVACRLTAARLYDFDLVLDGPPELVCRVDRRPSLSGRHRVHCSTVLRDSDVVRRNGIPLTSPLRTLRDVASLLPPGSLDRFVGHLLANRHLTVQQLASLVDAAGGRRPGSPALRQSAERAGVSVAPDSVLEHRTLLLLRKAALPDPVTQLPVRVGDRLVGVVDFAWPDARVVLEVDGYRWHGDPGTFTADRRRDNTLHALGWSVYRTTAADIRAGARELLGQLRSAITAG